MAATAPKSVFARQSKSEYTVYDVELTLRNALCGGIPGDPNMIRGWLQRNAGVVSGEDQHRRMIIETLEGIAPDVVNAEEAKRLSELELSALLDRATELVGASKVVQFKRTKNGELCLEDRQIKAMLKECAAVLEPTRYFSKETGKPIDGLDGRKGKTLKSLIPEWVFIDPLQIALGVKEPTMIEQKVGHVQGRSTLGLFELVQEPVIKFTVSVLHDLIPQPVWAKIWVLAERNGLGANRSMGYGQFLVTKWVRA